MWKPHIFGVTWKPQILVGGRKPQILGVTWKPQILGAKQKPQIFCACQILGAEGKPQILDVRARHGNPNFPELRRLFCRSMETPNFPLPSNKKFSSGGRGRGMRGLPRFCL